MSRGLGAGLHARRVARLNAAAWPLLALLLALGSLWLSPWQGGAGLPLAALYRWDWQPALAGTEPWRWWSAAWVHWSPMHLRMNLGGVALLAWLGWRAQAGSRAAAAWALAWPLTQLGLLWQPTLLHYGGLSGVLHAGIVILAWQLGWGPVAGAATGEPAGDAQGADADADATQAGRRRIGALIALGLLVKLGSEQAWLGPTHAVAGWDFQLAPLAHVSGAVAGLWCAALWLRPWFSRRPIGRRLRR